MIGSKVLDYLYIEIEDLFAVLARWKMSVAPSKTWLG